MSSNVSRLTLAAAAGALAFALACGGGDADYTPPPDFGSNLPPEPGSTGGDVATPSPSSTASAADVAKFAAWKEYTGNAGFKCKMPDVPEDTSESMDTPLGAATMRTFGASTFDPIAYYMVSTTDYPAGFVSILGVEAALDAARDGMVQGAGGVLLDEQKTTYAGNSTRRFKIKANAEGFEMWMIGRIFIVGDRVYIVAVSTTDASADSWADAWMDTLKV